MNTNSARTEGRMTAPMNEKVPGVERRPATVDTTIAEYVANAAHGSRYGVDWVYHDDRLGYLLTKPIRDPDIFLRTLRQNGGWQPIETAPIGEYALISGFNYQNPAMGRWVDAGIKRDGQRFWHSSNGPDEGFSEPTHWQPLPAPPATAGRDAK